VAAWRSDTIGRGWTPQDAAGRLRRFVVCMAWKRSGVRFPLAPLHESPGQALVAGGASSPRAGGSVVLDPFLDPIAGSLDPLDPFASARANNACRSMASRARLSISRASRPGPCRQLERGRGAAVSGAPAERRPDSSGDRAAVWAEVPCGRRCRTCSGFDTTREWSSPETLVGHHTARSCCPECIPRLRL
jgi:hypothetical protein